MPNEHVQAAPAAEVSNPLQADRTDTIEAAVSRLVQEPEVEETPASLEQEPEDTAEPSEVEEPADELEEEQEEAPEQAEELESEEEAEEELPEGEEELEYFAVKVDGEEIEVTLDELQGGYQRQKDYTQKTQALAEERKALEAKADEVEKLQEQYIQQAQLANELLNRDLKKYEDLNWEEMKVTDPVGFLQKQIEVGDIQKQQAQLREQAQAVYERNLQVEQQERMQHLEAQRKEALRLFPDWSDPQKAETQKAKLAEYGRSQGYTESELSSITDAKDLLLLDKAMKYDATQKGLTKKQTAPAVRKRVKKKGLAPKGANKRKQVVEKRETLRKSGSTRDAAALLMEMRSGNSIKK
jgi:hypothetical protein